MASITSRQVITVGRESPDTRAIEVSSSRPSPPEALAHVPGEVGVEHSGENELGEQGLHHPRGRPSNRSGSARADGGELLTVKLRYKHPQGDESRLSSFAVPDEPGCDPGQATPDARCAAAVAKFGLLLRGSPHEGWASWAEVAELAAASAGDEPYRREFLELVELASRSEGWSGRREEV